MVERKMTDEEFQLMMTELRLTFDSSEKIYFPMTVTAAYMSLEIEFARNKDGSLALEGNLYTNLDGIFISFTEEQGIEYTKLIHSIFYEN